MKRLTGRNQKREGAQRLTLRDLPDGTCELRDGDEHVVIIQTRVGAASLVDVINRALAIPPHEIVSNGNPNFAREILAYAVAKVMGWRLQYSRTDPA